MFSCFLALVPIHSSLGQANEHETRASIHPCGESNADLTNLTGFLEFRWKATHADLDPVFVAQFLLHFDLLHTDISLIRVFKSQLQPKLGIVAARRFTNYLNDEILVDLWCVVKLYDEWVMSISPETLGGIFADAGSET